MLVTEKRWMRSGHSLFWTENILVSCSFGNEMKIMLIKACWHILLHPAGTRRPRSSALWWWPFETPRHFIMTLKKPGPRRFLQNAARRFWKPVRPLFIVPTDTHGCPCCMRSPMHVRPYRFSPVLIFPIYNRAPSRRGCPILKSGLCTRFTCFICFRVDIFRVYYSIFLLS